MYIKEKRNLLISKKSEQLLLPKEAIVLYRNSEWGILLKINYVQNEDDIFLNFAFLNQTLFLYHANDSINPSSNRKTVAL